MRVIVGAAALVFSSGLCALVYQTVWLREARLIFGASTPSTAAVLGLFMGGLGLGSLLFGKRADKAKQPLLMYALLELGIALAAALSPFLLDLARAIYIAIGGSSTLGDKGATIIRLGLAALVLGAPAVLMGGTLPAIARAVTRASDTGRRQLALLYGLNTLGAVCGVLAPTFFLFERLGFRTTLWLACLLNLMLATLAWALARLSLEEEAEGESAAMGPAASAAANSETGLSLDSPRRAVVIGAAFAVGFVFFLAELVWYRMSAPILGGTTYTFGVVLACALVGIGLGGLLYAVAPPRRASLALVGVTCALEAAFLLVPYALGDHLAYFAYHLRFFATSSFPLLSSSWVLICAVLIVPSAVVAGYQLPLLVAVAGSGDEALGTDVGHVYAANTLGAVTGSLLGGFWLLPLLSALTLWTAIGLLLVGVGALATFSSRARRRELNLAFVALAIFAASLATAEGPTAIWRHTGIGSGRARLTFQTANDRKSAERLWRDFMLEQHEGRESSLGFHRKDGLGVFVNGKSDGNARSDAATTVGLSLIPAALHPDPNSAFVIGLAAGQSAGFLGKLDSINSVDVAEIEPAMLRFTELCATANERVLENEKVKVHIADGREVLTTSRARYDIIVSEPSNPYRAGVASLYTQEFYEIVAEHLNRGGMFAQWVQGYELSPESFSLIVATLRSVFPHVSVWQLEPADFLLLATQEVQQIDVDQLRERLQNPSLLRGLRKAVLVADAETLLARHIASPDFTTELTKAQPLVNTDDYPLLEFSAARSVGHAHGDLVEAVIQAARARKQMRPRVRGGVDWRRVEMERNRPYLASGTAPRGPAHPFWVAVANREFDDAIRALESLDPHPADAFTLTAIGELLAGRPDQREAFDATLAKLAAADAHTDVAWLRLVRRLLVVDEPAQEPTSQLLEDAITRLRTDPWANYGLVYRALQLLSQAPLSEPDARLTVKLLVEAPFAVHIYGLSRWETASMLSGRLMVAGIPEDCVELFEQHVPFEEPAQRLRIACYEAHAPSRVAEARAEYEDLLAGRAQTFDDLFEGAPAPVAD